MSSCHDETRFIERFGKNEIIKVESREWGKESERK